MPHGFHSVPEAIEAANAASQESMLAYASERF